MAVEVNKFQEGYICSGQVLDNLLKKLDSRIPGEVEFDETSEFSSFFVRETRMASCQQQQQQTSHDQIMHPKRVSFDSIEIIMLPMIMGDHPACTDGPPVQTSWEQSYRHCFSVDEFEKRRSPYRRNSNDLYLSSVDRSRIVGLEDPVEDDCDNSTIEADTCKLQSKSEQTFRLELKEEGLLLDYAIDRAQKLAERLAEREMRRVFQRAKRSDHRVARLVDRFDMRQRKHYERRKKKEEKQLKRKFGDIEQLQPTSPAA
eukprot:scaffold1549_cov105-Cylindrotheca_fusiformis.AAC.8